MQVIVALLAGIFLAGEVRAQLSASATAVTDYRFRGISQSDRRPALQASVAFDHPAGFFAGLFASTVDFGAASNPRVEAFVQAGYARRVDADFSWELGAGYYSYYGSGRASDRNYAEGFVGVTWRTLNARVNYAPDYFGGGTQSTYVEVNSSHALSERTALFAHVGVTYLAGSYTPAQSRSRVDTRFGVSVDLQVVSLELSAVATDIRGGECPGGRNRCKPGVVVAISRSF
ncbi:MAG: TorF family putative porin [Casimicrobiaceae bacterium]